MRITDMNTQNAISFSRPTEPRFSEAVSESSVSAAVPETDNSVPSDIELGQKTGGYAENEIASEKLDNRQANVILSKAISEANKKLEPMSVEFQFSIHEKTGRVNVKIVNSDTKEVVREVPSQKSLDMLAKIWELTGLIVDDKK